MSHDQRPEVRYRIHLTEERVYSIDITAPEGSNLEAWARDGWNEAGLDTSDLVLRERRLVEVEVRPADQLPWAWKEPA